MECKGVCFGASMFALGSLFCMFKDPKPFVDFYKTLDQDQLKTFMEIKKDRMYIWLKSTILGIIMSVLVHKFTLKGNNLSNTCTMVLVYFLTQYLVYSLHPKKRWMLNHLRSIDQNKAWLNMYNSMKYRWHFGLLFGLISYGFFSYYLQINKSL